jgi:hypothetical protein
MTNRDEQSAGRAQLILRIDPELHEAVRKRSFAESLATGSFTPMNTTMQRALVHYLNTVPPYEAALYDTSVARASAIQSGVEQVIGPDEAPTEKKK